MALALAWLLAVLAGLLPALAPGLPVPAALAPARVLAAGDELEVATSAGYVVDADAGRVRVTVELEAVNRKPDTRSGGVITRFRYDAATLAVPPEAARVRATDDRVRLDVEVTRRDGYKVVTVPFADPLYFGDRASVEVTFDLRAGRLRSASGVRIGDAFISFPVWAYGDRGSVRVVVPAGYEVSTRGRDMDAATSPKGATILSAATEDPLAWYAFVDAAKDSAMATRDLALPGGERVLVRSWPEDAKWRRVAGRTLADGIPELQRRIGLPWPVAGTLTVSEVHTPLLEGYAGFYDPNKAQITIGEQLDRLTIIHEASHAWFNGRLFTERWITEGLAEEYAARVVRAQGVDVPGPSKVKRDQKGSFALGAWPPPGAIGDQATVRRERYGYAASWAVMRKVVSAAGEAGMRRVFAAAADGTTAYPGDGPAERATIPNDWRRLVDLAEERGGADDVAALVARWALPADADVPLEAREEARAAYRRLVAEGGAWAAPVAVRMALDGWEFDAADRAADAASAALDARDALAPQAAVLGLDVPASFEAAYERAATAAEIGRVTAALEEAGDALGALEDATVAVAAPREWLADLGLGEEDPVASLDAARARWATGDAAGARDDAVALAARVEGATDAGTTRLATIAVVPAAAALVLVVVGIAVGVRRRRAG